MIVVAYYTNRRYQTLAARLGESARDLGLRFAAVERPDLGSWAANVNQKPGVVARALDHHQEDVLYIDADATILRPPVELARVGARPGAAHYPEPGKPAGGTMFFRRSPEARRLVDLWQKNVDRSPGRSDDFVNLAGALRTLGVKLAHLPPAYCWHEASMRPRYPGAAPVIVHQCVGEHSYRRTP